MKDTSSRKTQQRHAIRQVLATADGPLSAPEIHEAAQRLVPGLGMATVYRNLKVLTDEGWLTSVELGGDPGRFEVADKDHHHHFRCTVCERVYDVSGCSASVEAGAPEGFVVRGHELVLLGFCPDCS